MLESKSETSEEFSDFTKNINKIFDTSNDLIHDARNKIKILKNNNTEIVVKSYKVPSLLNKIIYTFFREPKAYRAYHYAKKLEDMNIKTAKAYSYICFYKNYLLDKSYFISEKIDYDFTMKRVFDDDTIENHDEILIEFGKFAKILHDNNVEHKDFSPGNILVEKTDLGYEFSIIDINRMKFEKMNFEQRMNNLCKLWTNEKNIKLISHKYCMNNDLDEKFIYEKILTNNTNDKNKKLLKRKIKIFLGLYKEK